MSQAKMQIWYLDLSNEDMLLIRATTITNSGGEGSSLSQSFRVRRFHSKYSVKHDTIGAKLKNIATPIHPFVIKTRFAQDLQNCWVPY
jgi:hypothetical protein